MVLDLGSEKSVRVPFRVDTGGTVRVGNTRVSLVSVLTAFKQGDAPEQIFYSFPTLELSDIYAVISYYLTHREHVDAWLEQEHMEGERIRREVETRFDSKGIRDRLLKRSADRGGSH